MHPGRTGHDVTADEVTWFPIPVGHEPASLGHQEGAGGDVPDLQPELEVAAEHPSCGVGEIQARSPRATHILN